MRIGRIRAVIFDMDGVIVDSEAEYMKLLYEFVKGKNPYAKIQQLTETAGKTAEDTWSVVARVVHNGQTWEELRTEYRALDPYGAVDYRALYRTELTAVLVRLKEQGYRLAVASSSPLSLVKRALKSNGILEDFDVIVSGEQFKRSKPDPEIYRFTAERLGVKPEECFALEDSTVGIRAAHDAGMVTAALIDDRFGFDRSLADVEVAKIQDILDTGLL